MAPFSAQNDSVSSPKSPTLTEGNATSSADECPLPTIKEDASDGPTFKTPPVMLRKDLNASSSQVGSSSAQRSPSGKSLAVTPDPADDLLEGMSTRPLEATSEEDYVREIVWKNVFLFTLLHSTLVYAAYIVLFYQPVRLVLFAIVFGTMCGLGVTAGAHRLWSHKSYKAKLPLRTVLAIFQAAAGQNDIYEWCRDHRVHHKYSETDADPHNAKRGFFFSHMGWLCCKKHPLVFSKGSSVDCSDLLADPVVRLQHRFYFFTSFVAGFLVPALIPYYGWNEDFVHSFTIASLARYCVSLHLTWLVNSAAHIWGMKPYDKHIGASENPFVIVAAIGEGFHNYHHTFPWDYATSEYGTKWNLTAFFIKSMASIGQAYDLKTTSHDVIEARVLRTGDLTCERNQHLAPPSSTAAEDISLENLSLPPREPNYNCVESYLDAIKQHAE